MSTDDQATEGEKTLDEVYVQRGEAWMLAMAFAKLAGFEVGIREPGAWPVHYIMLPGDKEVALHMALKDAELSILKLTSTRAWDGHTNEDKSTRIRAFVNETFTEKRW